MAVRGPSHPQIGPYTPKWQKVTLLFHWAREQEGQADVAQSSQPLFPYSHLTQNHSGLLLQKDGKKKQRLEMAGSLS